MSERWLLEAEIRVGVYCPVEMRTVDRLNAVDDVERMVRDRVQEMRADGVLITVE